MDILSTTADVTDNLITSLAIVIEIAHYTLVIYGVRSDWDRKKSWQHPLATWLMSLACCFGGGVLVNIAVGKPALTPLANNQSVALMTIVWWHVFYSPMDAIHSLLKWKPAMLVVVLLKEMIRTRKIMKAVKLARGAFPNSLLLCTVLGMLGACGGGFVKNALHLLRSQWNHESVKNFSFSPVTKLCLLFSLLYNLQMRGVLLVTISVVVLLQVATLFLVSASMKLGFSVDLFHPIERLLTSLTIDYSMFVGGEQEPETKKKETNTREETTSGKKPTKKNQKKND